MVQWLVGCLVIPATTTVAGSSAGRPLLFLFPLGSCSFRVPGRLCPLAFLGRHTTHWSSGPFCRPLSSTDSLSLTFTYVHTRLSIYRSISLSLSFSHAPLSLSLSIISLAHTPHTTQTHTTLSQKQFDFHDKPQRTLPQEIQQRQCQSARPSWCGGRLWLLPASS